MDPDANLARQREIVVELDLALEQQQVPGVETQAVLASELIDLVRGLDEWMSKGGFAPEAWQQ